MIHMRSAARRGDRAIALAQMQPLEERTLLSDGSNIKIPVMNYHRILPTIDDPLDTNLPDEYLKPHHITEDQFKSQLAALAARNFQSVTPGNYLKWIKGEPLRVGLDDHVLREGEHPFMAIFDDGNKTELRAAELMKQYNFSAVAAIATQDDPNHPETDGIEETLNFYVGNVARGYMTWDDIRTLSASYKWEIISHSRDHQPMGDGVPRDFPNKGGTAKVAGYFRNTPGEIDEEVRVSRQDIIDNVFGGDVNRAPIAFIHPRHDLTRRTLAVASAYYPLVFGRAFATDDPAQPPQFIGKTSNLANGELVRIEVVRATTQSNFEKMLDAAANTATTYQPPVFVQRETPVGYVASDGTVVVDGMGTPDTITVNGESVTLPVWDDQTSSMTSQPVSIKTFRINQYAVFAGYRTGDIYGGRGNDRIGVIRPLAVSTGRSVISGGDGNDIMTGGDNDETINGGAGKDLINGGLGNDRLNGNGGHDRLFGGAGADRLYGYEGNDLLDGGSSGDRLDGGNGADILYGQGGTDRFATRDGVADQLFGGRDRDTALVDSVDVLGSIESFG